MPNITISEFHGPDGYANEIIISGDIDKTQAKGYLEDWCETTIAFSMKLILVKDL